MPSNMTNAAGLYFESFLAKLASKRFLPSMGSIMVIEMFFFVGFIITLVALIITICIFLGVIFSGFKCFDVTFKDFDVPVII